MGADFLLMIDGIKAEPAGPKGKRGIEVLSFSWDISDAATLAPRSKGEAGKVAMQDIHFASVVAPTSPQLMWASTHGERFKKAVLKSRTPRGSLAYTLEDVLVSGYQTSGTESDGLVDQFTLRFKTAQMDFRQEKADGSADGVVAAGWDLTQSARA